jgi:hypothetical protein
VRFRLPVTLSRNAELAFELTHENRTIRADKLEVVADQGLQWLQVRLPPLPPESAGAPFRVRLAPLRGEVYVGFDTLREYGRTRVFAADGKAMNLPFEAAAELIWEKEKKEGNPAGQP